MADLLIRNIPSAVMAIMIATCCFVDAAVAGQPRHMISKIPIAAIAIAYTILNNTRKRPAPHPAAAPPRD